MPGKWRIVNLGLTDFEQLTEEEMGRFRGWHYVTMPGLDNAYYQYRLGMFDEDRWQMSLGGAEVAIPGSRSRRAVGHEKVNRKSRIPGPGGGDPQRVGRSRGVTVSEPERSTPGGHLPDRKVDRQGGRLGATSEARSGGTVRMRSPSMALEILDDPERSA